MQGPPLTPLLPPPYLEERQRKRETDKQTKYRQTDWQTDEKDRQTKVNRQTGANI